jgi:hypothetical protein
MRRHIKQKIALLHAQDALVHQPLGEALAHLL